MALPQLRIVVIQRDLERFVGVCLDHFVAAHGRTVDEVEKRLWGVLQEHLRLDAAAGRPPLSTLKPARDEYAYAAFASGTPHRFGSAYDNCEVRLAS